MITNGGTEQEVNIESFLGKIPVTYWPSIAANKFGLGPQKTMQFSFPRLWPLVSIRAPGPSDSRRHEIIQWLCESLDKLGIADGQSLSIRWSNIKFDRDRAIELKRDPIGRFDVELR